MNHSTLRRLIVVSATAGILASGVAPALADSGRPRPVAPSSPPGLGLADPDRPEQAVTPRTGPGNRDHSF
jgi:hypothetical protein